MTPEQAVHISTLDTAMINFIGGLYDDDIFSLVKKEEIRDIFSSGQVISKKWLLTHFNRIFRGISHEVIIKIAVVGGWVGILAAAIAADYNNVVVDSIDIDVNSTKVAAKTLENYSGSAICQDMYEVDYASYDCVVNTSCEHIEDLSRWAVMIRPGTFLVAQSNNARDIPGHISCVDSADELANKLKLSEIYFTGQIEFPMYTRFMVIGKK
jgi:trans-aconitate methyltransferase